KNFGPVIYISSEELGAATLTDKLNILSSSLPANLHFVRKLSIARDNLSDYSFIIFDSVSDLGIDLKLYKQLREENPNAAFIIVLQHTKNGQFRGDKTWEHEVEIGARVENYAIQTYRNRYGVFGNFNFYDERLKKDNE
ncbi:MAG TPA: hypothetical protein VK750_01590, partial [Cytophagaceae bacterium]|nr:hypothetical protein [Cytophagaceae bacterium]